MLTCSRARAERPGPSCPSSSTQARGRAGLLLADATGRVEPILPIRLTLDTYEVRFLVDLDGDGQDEVVWNSRYYEGDYMMLMAWDAAGVRGGRMLTGDGA